MPGMYECTSRHSQAFLGRSGGFVAPAGSLFSLFGNFRNGVALCRALSHLFAQTMPQTLTLQPMPGISKQAGLQVLAGFSWIPLVDTNIFGTHARRCCLRTGLRTVHSQQCMVRGRSIRTPLMPPTCAPSPKLAQAVMRRRSWSWLVHGLPACRGRCRRTCTGPRK